MSAEAIRFERDEDVASITIARPEALNALNSAMWRRLAELLMGVANDRSIRAIVLRGEGERAFSAGADIREFPAVRTGGEQAAAYDRLVGRALEAIQSAPQPVLAVIHGIAVGGGLELAAACDLRIASESARFGLPIGRLGVMPGLVRALLRLLPPGRVVELVLRGELLDAEEAHRWGLVTEVVAKTDLERAVQEWVERLRQLSPDTIAATKAVTRLAVAGASEEHAAYRALLEQVYGGRRFAEGVRAFLEKRPPRFEES